MNDNLNKWFRFSLFNLILIALYGTLMRYKIGFEFPFLDQKFLLHAHSHFAFAGWITHTLMVLMVMSIQRFLPAKDLVSYRNLFIANLVCAYGMLVAFTVQGYGTVSITFSTISILVTYFFAWKFAMDIKHKAALHRGKKWFLAALFFNVLSTFGTYALVYMMKTKNVHLDYYLAAVYYFLHFQYNGWFFFACMGLFWNKVLEYDASIEDKTIFRLFFWACIPAYLLSTLWMKFPPWLYWLIVLAAGAQVIAWVLMLVRIKKIIPTLKSKISRLGVYLLIFVAITFSIKLLLQLFSTIPIISKLAFGFRPIVIAYLHLVLLAIISVFLLGWLTSFNHIKNNKLSFTAIWIFLSGVFLNEFALMIQGIAAFAYFPVPFINETLFIIAAIMLIGAGILFTSQLRKTDTEI